MNGYALRALTVSMTVMLLSASPGFGEAQLEQAPNAEAKVSTIMQHASSRFTTHLDGVKQISWQPPTDEEISEIRSLGELAVDPLAKYLDSAQKDDLTQLLAVKFLAALKLPSTSTPLKLALAPDRWEITRAAALSTLYDLSQSDAKPYVQAALADKSALVRQRAKSLMDLYAVK
jgi:hypothetical protein